jgi:hypothetical protein
VRIEDHHGEEDERKGNKRMEEEDKGNLVNKN